MTCPHCRAFDEEGVPHVIAYVKSGQLSWEFRNYVRDAYDVSAALIARCNGAASFFPLTRAFYKTQTAWEAKIQATPQDQLKKSIEGLPTNRLFAAAASVAGLQQLAAAHGLSPARSNQCLSNARSVDQLVNMVKAATDRYPDFPGTPTFVINGTMVERAASWDALAPELKKALGERG
jgi:protein-disulfide isomerase